MTQERLTEMSPNRLASKQEFEQIECELQAHQANGKRLEEVQSENSACDDSLERASSRRRPSIITSGPAKAKKGAKSVPPRGHIFCRKEVVQSVNRVL